MSSKRALWIAAVADGLFTFGTQAMALNPQPLPPRWSQATITSSKSLGGPQTMARKAGGDPFRRSTRVGR